MVHPNIYGISDGPSGIAVELHCKCMNDDSTLDDMTVPWYNNEYEILTPKEYKLLSRYHKETCNDTKRNI